MCKPFKFSDPISLANCVQGFLIKSILLFFTYVTKDFYKIQNTVKVPKADTDKFKRKDFNDDLSLTRDIGQFKEGDRIGTGSELIEYPMDDDEPLMMDKYVKNLNDLKEGDHIAFKRCII